jgi:hydrogenase maturation factor
LLISVSKEAEQQVRSLLEKESLYNSVIGKMITGKDNTVYVV